MAGTGECSFEMLNGINRVNIGSPTATAISASTAIQEPGETDRELRNTMLYYTSALLSSRRGAAARTQGAVGARKPCCVSQGGRGAKKSYRLRAFMHQGWHLFYTYT